MLDSLGGQRDEGRLTVFQGKVGVLVENERLLQLGIVGHVDHKTGQ